MILDQSLQAIGQDSRQSVLVAILETVSQITHLSATPVGTGESTVKVQGPASMPGATETAWVRASEESRDSILDTFFLLTSWLLIIAYDRKDCTPVGFDFSRPNAVDG